MIIWGLVLHKVSISNFFPRENRSLLNIIFCLLAGKVLTVVVFQLPTSSPNPCPDHPPSPPPHTHTPHYTGSPSDQLPFAPTPIFLRGMVHEREFNAFLANKVWSTAFTSSANIQNGIARQPLVRLTRFSKRLNAQDTYAFDALLILRIGQKETLSVCVCLCMCACVSGVLLTSHGLWVYILFGMLVYSESTLSKLSESVLNVAIG